MSYFWVRFLHVASALLFVAVHGTSMAVFYLIRGERDRGRIQGMLALSAKTVVPMYATLALATVTGVVAGNRVGAFSRGWGWASLVLLGLITGLMVLITKPIHRRILAACELRPSGVPRVADEDLASVLKTPMTHVIALIGLLGIGGLVYLMIFKPF